LPILTYHPTAPVFGAAVGGDHVGSCQDLWRRKTSPWANVWCYFHDPIFSCFGTLQLVTDK